MITKSDLMNLTKDELAEMVLNLQRDPLTGFYKRQYLQDADECMGSVVGFCDINGLKAINDTEGHEAGDNYILEVCKSIRENTREEDTVVRWGGDEFIIIFDKCTVEDAERACQRIENACCGVGQSNNLESAIRIADRKMYEKKKAMYAQK